MDRDGNVYFTEMVAQRIMQLSANGVLSTFREHSSQVFMWLANKPLQLASGEM